MTKHNNTNFTLDGVFFLSHYTLFAFGDIKNRTQDNNTQRCEEEKKMDKKFMNKMDNMELDKVAGGKRYVYPSDDRRPNRPIKTWHIERKQVIRYR